MDAHFHSFFLDNFHFSLLVLSYHLINTPAAADLPHAPCLTPPARPAVWRRPHAAGCLYGWTPLNLRASGGVADAGSLLPPCEPVYGQCPSPLPCAAPPPHLTLPLSCALSSSLSLLAPAAASHQCSSPPHSLFARQVRRHC